MDEGKKRVGKKMERKEEGWDKKGRERMGGGGSPKGGKRLR